MEALRTDTHRETVTISMMGIAEYILGPFGGAQDKFRRRARLILHHLNTLTFGPKSKTLRTRGRVGKAI